MDETIAPSGTVDPSKVIDELDGVASFHISESDGEGFPVSPHTQTRASSLQRAYVPHKSTVRKTRVTMENSGEEFSASPHRHVRASPLHQNLPLSPRHTESQKTTNKSSLLGRLTKDKTVFHRRAPESWASPFLHAHTGEVRFTGPGPIPRRKPSYPTGRQIVLFRTKRLSRWKKATKAYKKTTKEDPTRGAPDSRAVPPPHAHTTNLCEERRKKTLPSGELRTTGSFRLSVHAPERFTSSSGLSQ